MTESWYLKTKIQKNVQFPGCPWYQEASLRVNPAHQFWNPTKSKIYENWKDFTICTPTWEGKKVTEFCSPTCCEYRAALLWILLKSLEEISNWVRSSQKSVWVKWVLLNNGLILLPKHEFWLRGCREFKVDFSFKHNYSSNNIMNQTDFLTIKYS